ncbi:Galactosyl transferase [Cordyceps fumosorosea ARSEF 2679]|uniref:Galactosyl transferase n=1 Tax=Cordyceps fumosorosea (strain ARSEF 2679) TaxID=1081104 RepID=A0A162JIS7_CORFA|nr:Galactosyl transferase [Cordyceps fumosorosea ARSEF 2679]OAA69622.1 Galactosyl transferase [Cordyceps fumosorosea ARSEF 2679]
MHFAYPPRKSSDPPPYRPRSGLLPFLRRGRLRTIVLGLLACILVLYLMFRPSKQSPYHERQPAGTPSVVLVTVLDTKLYSAGYLKTVRENREEYASRHGYKTVITEGSQYDTAGAPTTWTKLMATHHALAKFPDCKFVWYLDQDAYIMNPSQSLEDLVLQPKQLESLMIRGQPVVPPDSIIKTFSHLRGEHIDVILSQDKSGLVHNNIIIRNGAWAKFFLETWLDPLYRSYNFQKAERHALEHLVQWHPTILSKLALVPQRTFASYSKPTLGEQYQEGDFIAMFAGCSNIGRESCEVESGHFWEKWKANFG